MKNVLLSSCLFAMALGFAGCQNPGIVQLSPDTYMLTRQDHGGVFGNFSALKAGVIRDANEFAAKQGKIAIPLTTNEKPVGYRPADWASFEYQFRVVDKNDPEARRTSLTPRADLVIEKTEKISADIRTKEESDKKADFYTELIKLDDLRKKGLITDKEFEAQKQKLLNASK